MTHPKRAHLSRSHPSGLNPEQAEAVCYTKGPLLVLAGAGSGKTRVITEKIVYLIRTEGLEPHQIAAVTFTNKAAREMKERIGKRIPAEQLAQLPVSTFHTLGLNIIRKEMQHLPLRHGFSIFDSDDSRMLLKDFLMSSSRDDSLLDIAQQTISGWKNSLFSPEQAMAKAGNKGEQSIALAYQRYQDALRAYNSVDFDDLIQMPVNLLEKNTDVLKRWREQIRYLLVDEYQDTNSSQYRLVHLLAGDSGSLTAVGDDDQSIYAWRGAKPENLHLLQQDFPGLRIIKLEQNYRSAGRILKSANTLIKNNSHLFEKRLWSELDFGAPIRVLQLENEDEETERIATDIIARCVGRENQFRDFAVLYRGNHQSRLIELKLQQHRIPYTVSGGTSFFARSEIKDILAYLRLITNPDDDTAFLRIINTPRRSIGSATLEKLGQFVQGEKSHGRHCSMYTAIDNGSIQEFIKGDALDKLKQFANWMDRVRRSCYEREPASAIREMIGDIGYESWLLQNSSSPLVAEKRMENVSYLVDSVVALIKEGDAQDRLGEALNRLLLQDRLDQEEEDAGNRVQLMTLHAAKGLEFPHVFMTGMEENLLPHRNSIETDTIEEERRLAYVGITRAQTTLTLTLAKQRKQYGKMVDCTPSRFLDELPPEDLEWEGGGKTTSPEAKQKKATDTLASLRALLNNQ